MTDEQIEGLKPGRELDCLIAEHLMGYEWWVHAPGEQSMHPGRRFLMKAGPWMETVRCLRAVGNEPIVGEELKKAFRVEPTEWSALNFSTDEAPAWKVVDELYEHGFNVRVSSEPDWAKGPWSCVLSMTLQTPGRYANGIYSGYGDNRPEAICKAALKAAFAGKGA